MCVCVFQRRARHDALFSLTEHGDFAAHRQRGSGHQIDALAAQHCLVVLRGDLQAEGAAGLLHHDVLLPNHGQNLAILTCRRTHGKRNMSVRVARPPYGEAQKRLTMGRFHRKFFSWNSSLRRCDSMRQSLLNRWCRRFTLVQWRVARGFPPWDTHSNTSTLPALTSSLSRPTITGGWGGTAVKWETENNPKKWTWQTGIAKRRIET